MSENFPVWTEEQTAEYLQTTVLVLRRMRKEGLGPKFTMVGAKPRYISTDVAEWMRSHQIDPADVIVRKAE